MAIMEIRFWLQCSDFCEGWRCGDEEEIVEDKVEKGVGCWILPENPTKNKNILKKITNYLNIHGSGPSLEHLWTQREVAGL